MLIFYKEELVAISHFIRKSHVFLDRHPGKFTVYSVNNVKGMVGGLRRICCVAMRQWIRSLGTLLGLPGRA